MAISRTSAQPTGVHPDAVPWRALADGRGRLERAPAPARFGTFSLFWLASSVALLSILLIGDAGAIARLDAIVVQRVRLGPALRVKLWTAEGKIVYSDEQRLIGQTFPWIPTTRFSGPLNRCWR